VAPLLGNELHLIAGLKEWIPGKFQKGTWFNEYTIQLYIAAACCMRFHSRINVILELCLPPEKSGQSMLYCVDYFSPSHCHYCRDFVLSEVGIYKPASPSSVYCKILVGSFYTQLKLY
jgi:hypothetical protein